MRKILTVKIKKQHLVITALRPKEEKSQLLFCLKKKSFSLKISNLSLIDCS